MNWLTDFKTRGQLQDDSSEETNLQHPVYQYVATANGVPISGSVTFQIINKAPAIPKMNKDRTMSRSVIATDWDTYEAALIRNGLNPKLYLDVKAKLNKEFVRVTRCFRSEEEVSRVWHSIILPAAWEMANGVQPIRSMGHFTCMNCAVRPICMASLKNYDTQEYLRGFTYDEKSDLLKNIEMGIL
jgi:hypothetical protein